jgi:hypothetical protein
MSFLKQANQGYNKDEFWSGQAIIETKFSVGDIVTARTSKVNNMKTPMGRTANAQNVSMQQHYLCVFLKSAAEAAGKTPPIVFDSLTGWAYIDGKDTKYTMMEKISLAGRLQSSVNYQGTIPEQDSISVQCGGMGAIRLFTKDPEQSFSWFDRLSWTIPDIEDPAKASAQYRHLRVSQRQEFPADKIPILVEKMSESLYQEFPREAMKHFCATITSDPTKFDYFVTPAAKESGNPLDAYILGNFIAPIKLMIGMFEFLDDGRRIREEKVMWESYLQAAGDVRPALSTEGYSALEFPDRFKLGKPEFHRSATYAQDINFAVLYMNVGLLSWVDAKKTLLHVAAHERDPALGIHAFIRRMDDMDDQTRGGILGVANQMLGSQYANFTYLRDHNFGKALSVANHGDGVRVLFRI